MPRKSSRGKSESQSQSDANDRGSMQLDPDNDEGASTVNRDYAGAFARFQPSPTPQDWVEDGSEWHYSAIMDHYIPQMGPRSYKIAWDDWQRKDGSNTTWQEPTEDYEKSIKEYEKERRGKRRHGVNKTYNDNAVLESDVNPGQLGSVHILSLRTVESRLYRPRQRDPRLQVEEHLREMEMAERASREADRDFGPNPLFAKPKGIEPELGSDDDEDILAESPGRQLRHSVPRGPSPAMSEEVPLEPQAGPGRPPPTESPYRETTSPNMPPAIDNQTESGQSRIPSGQARYTVQQFWDKATTAVGSSRVIVVDPKDGGYDCPDLPRDFEYLEQRYSRESVSWKPNPSSPARALGCRCIPACDTKSSASCACQSYSEFTDHFAYSINGRFLFENIDENGREAEVFECTQNCLCMLGCPNRTSQQPRNVELEIFKTGSYGWGVRCQTALPEGKVLGTFTGTLITRERAAALERSRRAEWLKFMQNYPDWETEDYEIDVLDRRGYIFDLDCRENHNEADGVDDRPGQKYSIDAWGFGNWTRFVNHSCSPNMKVFTAIVDPYSPEDPPPGRLVFVTMRAVKPGEQLTIDYNPHLKDMGKGKARKARPKGNMNLMQLSQKSVGWAAEAQEIAEAGPVVDELGAEQIRCDCDAPNCRGFIRI